MCCLASGSKGNCSYVSDGKTDILIDMGISATRVEKCLEVLGVDPDAVSIFVTHSHSDHINGLKVFCKKHPHATLHCQKESAPAVFYHTGVEPIVDDRDISIGELTIRALPVPHDVPCFGYVVNADRASVAVVTDIGAVSQNTLGALGACNIVMLEANHDPSMLRANRNYSPELKARILSSHGHLSNADCAEACAYLASGGVRNFILAHLSEENNKPRLALTEVITCLEQSGISNARVITASQNCPTGLFEVC